MSIRGSSTERYEDQEEAVNRTLEQLEKATTTPTPAQGRAGSVYRCTPAQHAAERAFNRALGQERKADRSGDDDD